MTRPPAPSVLLLASLLHAVGLALFARGFFLTRLELRQTSGCADLAGTPLGGGASEHGGGSGGCWSPRLYDRVVLLVIDAWRHDFAAWDEAYAPPQPQPQPLQPAGTAGDARPPPPPFVNRMPRLRTLLATRPRHSALYRFVADAPTVTAQRLKGLTSGSLPTFVDIGSNFASPAIAEDTVIAQLAAHYLRGRREGRGAGEPMSTTGGSNGSRGIVFMGDDTWAGLFPSTFTRSLPFPSFDVKDLDTVDNGVEAHLGPTLRGEEGAFAMPPPNGSAGGGGGGPWAVVVGHMLGVDHAGHRYHASHPSLAAKLGQVDRVIQEAVRDMEGTLCGGGAGSNEGRGAARETWGVEQDGACGEMGLLLVLGDHGMTADGNHGGASDVETGAALLALSLGRPLLSGSREARTIRQVDLVPSLALATGVPIPYASLGALIPDWNWAHGPTSTTDAAAGSSSSCDRLQAVAAHTRALAANAWQVDRYLAAYAAAAPSFAAAARTDALREAYDDGPRAYASVQALTVRTAKASGWAGGSSGLGGLRGGSTGDGAEAEAAAAWLATAGCRDSSDAVSAILEAHVDAQGRYVAFLTSASASTRALWTQFDVTAMGWGWACMLAGTVLCIHAALGSASPAAAGGDGKDENYGLQSAAGLGHAVGGLRLRRRGVTNARSEEQPAVLGLVLPDGVSSAKAGPLEPAHTLWGSAARYAAGCLAMSAALRPASVTAALGTAAIGLSSMGLSTRVGEWGASLLTLSLPSPLSLLPSFVRHSLAVLAPLEPPLPAAACIGLCVGYIRWQGGPLALRTGTSHHGIPLPTPSATSVLALVLLVARLWLLFSDTLLALEGPILAAILCAAAVVAFARTAAALGGHGDSLPAATRATVLRIAGTAAAVLVLSVLASERSVGVLQAQYRPHADAETASLGGQPVVDAGLPIEADSPAHVTLLHTLLPLVVMPFAASIAAYGAHALLNLLGGPQAADGQSSGRRGAHRTTFLLSLLSASLVAAHWLLYAHHMGRDGWLAGATLHLALPRAVYALTAVNLLLLGRGGQGSPPTAASATSSAAMSLAAWHPALSLVLGPWAPAPLAAIATSVGALFVLLTVVAWADSRPDAASPTGALQSRRTGPLASLWAVLPAPVCAVATHILQGSDVLITVAAGTALPGHAFTATGHAPRFSSLAYGAGFVGLDSFIPAPAGALLALNTYGPGMLLVLAPLVAALPPALGAVASDGVARRAALLLHVPPALVAVATCAFVAFARRHLLVWAVFAPKFVFDGVSLAFTIVVSCVHA